MRKVRLVGMWVLRLTACLHSEETLLLWTITGCCLGMHDSEQLS